MATMVAVVFVRVPPTRLLQLQWARTMRPKWPCPNWDVVLLLSQSKSCGVHGTSSSGSLVVVVVAAVEATPAPRRERCRCPQLAASAVGPTETGGTSNGGLGGFGGGSGRRKILGLLLLLLLLLLLVLFLLAKNPSIRMVALLRRRSLRLRLRKDGGESLLGIVVNE